VPHAAHERVTQAGYTALPEYALDDFASTFWSSTGGAVCCTESDPAWLLVSLGAPRPIAALRVLYQQDLTFTLALANASAGPFVVVAAKTCDVCVMNRPTEDYKRAIFPLPLGIASYVKLVVTWSDHGGIGGCNDLCDWASNIHTFGVFGPGALPRGDVLPPPPPQQQQQAAPACVPPVSSLLSQSTASDGFVLTGNAALGAPGSGKRGAGSVRLTGAAAASAGAIEFSRILHPATDCGCGETHLLGMTLYVRMGGGVMPGDGLAISLVDASKQTPGRTVFMPGCGVRAALPAHALSIVFDTAVSDPGCDEPGTGARVVSTLLGAQEPPAVLVSTLETSTATFRNGDWVTVQVELINPLSAQRGEESGVQEAYAVAVEHSSSLGGDAPYTLRAVYVNGDEMLNLASTWSRLVSSNLSLSAFYFVISARTGNAASDAHAVSGIHVECVTFASLPTWVEDWSALRQPLTPPPLGVRAQPPPPPRSAAGARAHVSAAVSLGAAFGAMLLLLLLAAVTWHCCAPAATPLRDSDDCASLLAVVTEAPPPLPETCYHVFLSYRRADWRLTDAVQDKLMLCGLRVFKDVDGAMAGRPFDMELLAAVRCTPVFSPIVTLASLRRLSQAVAAAEVDTSLAEFVAALYFRDVERTVLLIHPLLAAPEERAEVVAPAAKRREAPRWRNLSSTPEYAALLAALPDEVPAATMALVDAAMRRSCGVPLPAAFASLTVRQIMLGRAADAATGAAAVTGVLAGKPFELTSTVVRADSAACMIIRRKPAWLTRCACMSQDDFDLYVKGRFARSIFDALAAAAQGTPA
jgi:hypothetical protein